MADEVSTGATAGIESFEMVATPFDVRPFRIEQEPAGPRTVVLVAHGDADLHSAPEFRERLRMAIEGSATGIVVDLSDVAFVDSTSLGVLLGAMKQLREEGRGLRLVVPHSDVRRIFEVTLLDQVFPLDDTRAEALEALSSGAD